MLAAYSQSMMTRYKYEINIGSQVWTSKKHEMSGFNEGMLRNTKQTNFWTSGCDPKKQTDLHGLAWKFFVFTSTRQDKL